MCWNWVFTSYLNIYIYIKHTERANGHCRAQIAPTEVVRIQPTNMSHLVGAELAQVFVYQLHRH